MTVDVFIVWGKNPIQDESTPTRYTFTSRVAADAFLLGVNEAYQWLDYAAFDTHNFAQNYLDDMKRRMT